MSCIFLAITVSILSCKQDNSDSNNEESAKSEDNMNDNIQSTFFGVSFGDSEEQLFNSLKNHGFGETSSFNDEANNTYFVFRSTESKLFSFGNMSWEFLRIGINNNKKFFSIEFISVFEKEEEAKQKYEDILETITKKYKVAPDKKPDFNFYAIQKGYDKNNRQISLLYSHEENYGIESNNAYLGYKDLELAEEGSDEL